MKFLNVILEIVAATGETKRLMQRGQPFRLRIEHEPFMPLVIEAWDSPIAGENRRISVAHYFACEGDLVPDPEVEIRDDGWPIELSQRHFYTQVSWYAPNGSLMFYPQAKREVLGFLNGTWAPNLPMSNAPAPSGPPTCSWQVGHGLERWWAAGRRAQGFITAAQKLARYKAEVRP